VVVSRNCNRQLFGDSTDLLSLEEETLRLQEKLGHRNCNLQNINPHEDTETAEDSNDVPAKSDRLSFNGTAGLA